MYISLRLPNTPSFWSKRARTLNDSIAPILQFTDNRAQMKMFRCIQSRVSRASRAHISIVASRAQNASSTHHTCECNWRTEASARTLTLVNRLSRLQSRRTAYPSRHCLCLSVDAAPKTGNPAARQITRRDRMTSCGITLTAHGDSIYRFCTRRVLIAHSKASRPTMICCV